MAKYKEEVCMYYVSLGECKKGREACHEKYCQKCNKYYPRAKVHHINRKKRELQNNYKKADLINLKQERNYKINIELLLTMTLGHSVI